MKKTKFALGVLAVLLCGSGAPGEVLEILDRCL